MSFKSRYKKLGKHYNELIEMINDDDTTWGKLKNQLNKARDAKDSLVKYAEKNPNDTDESQLDEIQDDVAQHDKMVNLVEYMLDLNKRVHADGISTQEKKILQKQITITDKQIDTLVYELYDLTDEEIKIVEGDKNHI